MTHYEHYSECRDLETLKKYAEKEIELALRTHSSVLNEKLTAAMKVAKDKFKGSLFC